MFDENLEILGVLNSVPCCYSSDVVGPDTLKVAGKTGTGRAQWRW